MVAHHFREGVDAHRVNELGVSDCLAACEGDGVCVCVNALHCAVGAKSCIFFRKGVGDCDPYSTCSTVRRKTEGCIGSPIASRLLQNDIFHDSLHIWSGNSLTKPLALHLCRFS